MSTSLGQMPSLADLSYLFDNEKNAIKLLQQLGVFTTEKKKAHYANMEYNLSMVEVYGATSVIKDALFLMAHFFKFLSYHSRKYSIEDIFRSIIFGLFCKRKYNKGHRVVGT